MVEPDRHQRGAPQPEQPAWVAGSNTPGPHPRWTSSDLRAACGVESTRPSRAGDASVRGVFGPGGPVLHVMGPRHRRYDHAAGKGNLGRAPRSLLTPCASDLLVCASGAAKLTAIRFHVGSRQADRFDPEDHQYHGRRFAGLRSGAGRRAPRERHSFCLASMASYRRVQREVTVQSLQRTWSCAADTLAG